MKKIFLLMALAGLSFQFALAGLMNDTSSSVSIFYNYSNIYHKAEFNNFYNLPLLGRHLKAPNSNGYLTGLQYELELPRPFYAGLRMYFQRFGANYQGDAIDTVFKGVDTITNAPYHHTFNTDFAFIAFEPCLIIRPLWGFSFRLGGNIAFNVYQHHDQKIDMPKLAEGYNFVDTMKQLLNTTSGSIPQFNAAMSSFCFGMGYDFHLDRIGRFTVTPELSYHIGASELLYLQKWTANTLNYGLSFRYSPKVEPENIEYLDQNIKVDTLQIYSDKVSGRKYITGYTRSEKKSDKTKNGIFITENIFRTDTIYRPLRVKASVRAECEDIKIRTATASEIYPLVPSVFFERNSDRLLPAYQLLSSAKGFSFEALTADLMAYNHNLLNIIGERMLKNATANLSLKGYADSVSEGGSCELAASRANTVKNYLTKVFGISDDRITILQSPGACTPAKKPETTNDSGYSENRRVDFLTFAGEILDPIVKTDFSNSEVIDYIPREIWLNPVSSRMTGDAYWKVTLEQSGQLIYEKRDSTMYASGQPDLKPINLTKDLRKSIAGTAPIRLKLLIADKEQSRDSSIVAIPVVIEPIKSKLKRLSISSFEVSSAELSAKAKSQIENFVLGVSPISTIKISGYSDPLGNYESNIQLSEQRAKNAADYIRELMPKANISFSGYGSNRLPVGISAWGSPIERYLSRSVQIEILSD